MIILNPNLRHGNLGQRAFMNMYIEIKATVHRFPREENGGNKRILRCILKKKIDLQNQFSSNIKTLP